MTPLLHRLYISFLVVALLVVPAAAQDAQPGQAFSARVVEVTDGDTYDLRRSAGAKVTIRLHGVDASEFAQSYGAAAPRAARRYVGGKNVYVSVEDIGRYGRAVARVEVRDGDLGAMLIREGLAWHYRQYAPQATEYARLERQGPQRKPRALVEAQSDSAMELEKPILQCADKR